MPAVLFMAGSIVKSLKSIKLLTLAIALLGAMATSTAWAQRVHHGGHGHHHWRGGASVGLYFGAPLAWPYLYSPYYPYSYYPYYSPYYGPYYRSDILVQGAQSPEFVEQGQASAQNYWYFCSNPKGYYPYVKDCPPGWVQVTPQPPAGK